MSWVTALAVSTIQTVHVVSIEDVTIIEGAFSFHEKLVLRALVLPCYCTLDCHEVLSESNVETITVHSLLPLCSSALTNVLQLASSSSHNLHYSYSAQRHPNIPILSAHRPQLPIIPHSNLISLQTQVAIEVKLQDSHDVHLRVSRNLGNQCTHLQ